MTPRTSRNTSVVIFLAILATVFWQRHADSNDRRAHFVADGHVYRVELTGWRFPLVHDPLSLILGRTRRASLTLELPRIEGVVDGGEIPVGAGKLRYVGRVVVANRKMQVDLYYDDGRPLSWNDEYTLVRTDGTR